MNIYVGNLPFSASESEIRSLFEKFGAVDTVNIISDKFSGRSKGFGFVEMSDATQAQAAIQELNGKDMNGRALKVNEALPKTDRPRREGGFGGGRGGDRGGYGGGRGDRGGYGGGRPRY